jgi:hypothetical protein
VIRRFLFIIIYPKQLEQFWLVQPPQPEEELLILPLASKEAKEKLETSFFKFLCLQLGQIINSALLRTK